MLIDDQVANLTGADLGLDLFGIIWGGAQVRAGPRHRVIPLSMSSFTRRSARARSCILDAGIVTSRMIEQLHYEVEFAVVIGKYLHRQTPDQAMPAILGYTLLNDVSARDVKFKDNQITLGKNFAGFAPIGPWIVIADAMPHPDRLALKTRLNGKVMQNGITADWLFSLPQLIGHLA